MEDAQRHATSGARADSGQWGVGPLDKPHTPPRGPLHQYLGLLDGPDPKFAKLVNLVAALIGALWRGRKREEQLPGGNEGDWQLGETAEPGKGCAYKGDKKG